MRVFIATEFRCQIYKNKIYLAPKAYYIYKRYSDTLGDVVLCCRIQKVDKVLPGYQLAYFIRKVVPINSLLKVLCGEYNQDINEALRMCALVIARVPSIIAYQVIIEARKQGIPYLAEIMGDAWDSYWNHGILGKLIAPYMYLKMKQLVWNAAYAIYVTKYFLQKRYPCKNFNINASNVMIKTVPCEILNKRIEKIKSLELHNLTLMTTAAVNVQAKGQQFVIKAMKTLKKKGINITYYLAGGGAQDRLKKIAEQEGVAGNVIFLGELPMEQVYQWLDNIDIYIQPSLQEGLPRAVIEAMSRGCPCIGSRTAGTPELLANDRIFKRNSVSAIVDVILSLQKEDLITDAKRNFNEAQQYNEVILNRKRSDYLENIKNGIDNT